MSRVNGVDVPGVTRLNGDGSLDRSFSPTTLGSEVLAVQPDGKIVGIGFPRLTRVNPDGSADTSFTSGAVTGGSISAVALQPNGKIIVGGDFTAYAGKPRQKIARLQTDGSLDIGFDPGASIGGTDNAPVVVRALAVQANGAIIASVSSTQNGLAKHRLVRLFGGDLPSLPEITPQPPPLLAPGAIDVGFDPSLGPDDGVNALALRNDGKILVGGQFTNVNGQAKLRLARLLADGTLDATFDKFSGVTDEQAWPPDPSKISSIALERDGGILIGGTFRKVNGLEARCLARLEPNGEVAADFKAPSPRSFYSISAIVVQPDDKILAAGVGSVATAPAGTGLGPVVLRLQPDGQADPTFNPPVIRGQHAKCLAVDWAGKILVGGNFTNVAGAAVNHVVRLNTDGSLDATFDAGTGVREGPTASGQAWTSVNTMLLEPDAKILIGGQFSYVNDLPRTNIARLSGGPALSAVNMRLGSSGVQLAVLTVAGKSYSLQYKERLSSAEWTNLPAVKGDGAIVWLSDPNPSARQRFYRLRFN